MLYNVFSFYGDVERIRIIRKDEQNLKALVQFTTASHACMARDYLDQVTIRGAQLAVSFSRHNGVRTAREVGREEDGSTKDFSGAGLSARTVKVAGAAIAKPHLGIGGRQGGIRTPAYRVGGLHKD